MPPTVKPGPFRRRTAFVAALTALALAGCGLSDYERKMRDAEVRVERFDNENRLLGDALKLPSDAPAVNVFLRPPKGVKSTPETQPGELAYHYLTVNGCVCTDLYLTFGDAGDGKDKLERQIENRLGAPPQSWQPVEARPPERAPTAFDAVEFYDPRAPANSAAPAFYRAYVHPPSGSLAVGVVYRVLEANRTAAAAPLQASLETYADGADANQLREAFAKRLSR